jgi:hypothetical protein
MHAGERSPRVSKLSEVFKRIQKFGLLWGNFNHFFLLIHVSQTDTLGCKLCFTLLSHTAPSIVTPSSSVTWMIKPKSFMCEGDHLITQLDRVVLYGMEMCVACYMEISLGGLEKNFSAEMSGRIVGLHWVCWLKRKRTFSDPKSTGCGTFPFSGSKAVPAPDYHGPTAGCL